CIRTGGSIRNVIIAVIQRRLARYNSEII
ncbi:MAG: hypothetical protein RI979_2081, partial [Pseudomonadota bacterium]